MLTDDTSGDFASRTYEWFFSPPPGDGTLSQRRGLAWLETTHARMMSTQLGYQHTRATDVLDAARQLVATSEFSDWDDLESAIEDLESLLRHAWAAINASEDDQ